jgi:hypothetical protein
LFQSVGFAEATAVLRLHRMASASEYPARRNSSIRDSSARGSIDLPVLSAATAGASGSVSAGLSLAEREQARPQLPSFQRRPAISKSDTEVLYDGRPYRLGQVLHFRERLAVLRSHFRLKCVSDLHIGSDIIHRISASHLL